MGLKRKSVSLRELICNSSLELNFEMETAKTVKQIEILSPSGIKQILTSVATINGHGQLKQEFSTLISIMKLNFIRTRIFAKSSNVLLNCLCFYVLGIVK